MLLSITRVCVVLWPTLSLRECLPSTGTLTATGRLLTVSKTTFFLSILVVDDAPSLMNVKI